MLKDSDCWVPDCLYFEDYGKDFEKYENELYRIFKRDFLDSRPVFLGKPVYSRKYPLENDKEEAFYHITCNDYCHIKDRCPDFRRSERIEWCRAFIEKYKCEGYQCEECSGLFVWTEWYRGKLQTCILSEDYRYMVILEEREDYYLLVSAYYIESDRSLNKKLRNYDNAVRQLQ